MKKEKYLSLLEYDRKQIESLTSNENLMIVDIKIKSPNAPQSLMPAKAIKFRV
jgi:hypothetical protein